MLPAAGELAALPPAAVSPAAEPGPPATFDLIWILAKLELQYYRGSSELSYPYISKLEHRGYYLQSKF
jgi:hypothetical protein